MIVIKYGVSHNNITYGWFEKELYRLPIKIGLRYFGLKKLKLIPIGNKFGYKLSQKKFTIEQLKEKTVLLEKVFTETKLTDKNLPF